MEDKHKKETYSQPLQQQLTFTKQHRDQVWARIDGKQKRPTRLKRFSLLAVSIAVAWVALLLLMPALFSSQQTAVPSSSSVPVKPITVLLSVKDADGRVPINVLLSYEPQTREVRFVSLPRDTYVPMTGQEERFDKLTFAYQYGQEGAASVKNSVAAWLELPIDYYVVSGLQALSTVVQQAGGVTYALAQDVRVRGLTMPTLELSKGKQQLSAEQALLLLMDATVEQSLKQSEIRVVLQSMMETLQRATPQQLATFFATVETNMTSEQLQKIDWRPNAFVQISLAEGMQPQSIDEKYYLTFDPELLEKVREQLQ